MTRPPILKTTRLFALALSALATLFTLGLTSPTPAQADKGYITAKSWYDAAQTSHPYAVGDGVSDDTKNLQDLINYGLSHAEAVQLEPGIYRITSTLLIADNITNDQKIGFRLSGIAGPNLSPGVAAPPGGPRGGVSIVLDASATGQPAVLEVGGGAVYDLTIENVGLVSNVPSDGTPYGLLFGGQSFSHAYIHMVTVNNTVNAFAIDPQPGIPTGGNGEQVDLDECKAYFVNCFYYNHSYAGQALGHSIAKCGGIINCGGSIYKLGPYSDGQGVDITSSLFTFIAGPARNTLLECDSPPHSLNMTGGRIEGCDTLITYNGGSYGVTGQVDIRGIDFDATNAYIPAGSNAFAAKAFPLVDDTLNGKISQPNGQYTTTIEQCRFNGTGGPYPALSLVGIPGDQSRTFFDRDTFTGFSNSLTDSSNAPALANLGAKVRDCRSAVGGGSGLFTDISYP